MKASNVLQNKRAFTLTAKATEFCIKNFGKEERQEDFIRWLMNPNAKLSPYFCTYCRSSLVIRRKDLYECYACGSYLGKAQS